MLVIDDFLPNAEAVRAAALCAPFVDYAAQDGEVYRRVCPTHVPGLQEAVEAAIGPVDMHMTGYRLNFDGEMPNAAIHSDVGWGTHALVLYLCDGEGGTALWRHKATGAHRIDPGDRALFEVVRHEWDDEGQWEQTYLCPLKFNRACIYESALFHSRYPFAAFGHDAESGRLIAVAFFTPR